MFSFIAAEKTGYPVALMCRALQVNRTSFHDWEHRAPSDRALTDAWLSEKIKLIHEAKRKVYGAPRIHAELRMQYGIKVGRKRVERLMRGAGISGLVPKKRGRTTIAVPGVRVADDLVERQFQPDAPNVLWLADITYLRSWEGWLYLAAVQDAYSPADRWLVDGRAHARRARRRRSEMAVHRRRPDPGLIHHSDQGGQGGLNWSSQHVDRGGADGKASWVDDGVDGQGTDEVAGEAIASPRRGAVVLA